MAEFVSTKTVTLIKLGLGVSIITVCAVIASLPFFLAAFQSASIVIGSTPTVSITAGIAGSADSVQLTWTAPGDDASSGTSSSYDIRYATTMLSEANFNYATQVQNPPTPLQAGTVQTTTISGLSSGTQYFFALKSVDDAGNWSAISNIASITTRAQITSSCVELWTCSAWSACSNGEETRTCEDTNACGSTADRPSLTQACGTAPTIDDIAPSTYFTSTPPQILTTQRVYFNFSALDNSAEKKVFSYKMDSGPWSDWSDKTRAIYRRMTNGAHTFFVRAKDASGNIDTTPVETSFTTAYTPNIISAFEAGGSPAVLVLTTQGKVSKQFYAFEKTFRGGVQVTLGDFLGNGHKKIVAASGPGRRGEVAIFNSNGTKLTSFYPYGVKYRNGISVTVADIQGDGVDEVITARLTGKPDFSVFTFANGKFTSARLTTLAYSSGVSGLSLASADVDGDGADEIAVIPASTGQSLLRIFKLNKGKLGLWKPTLRVYPQSVTGGFTLSSGNMNNDLREDFIVSPKSSRPVQIKIVSLGTNNRLVFSKKTLYPFGKNALLGARVTISDIDGNKSEDFITSQGKKIQQVIRIYDGNTLKRLKNISLFPRSSRLILSLTSGVL